MANSIRYANQMPPDFATVLMKDYMYLEEDYKKKLMQIPDFRKWLEEKGSFLNGAL